MGKRPFFNEEEEFDAEVEGVDWRATISNNVAVIENGEIRCLKAGDAALQISVGETHYEGNWRVSCGEKIEPSLLEFWTICTLPKEWESMTDIARRSYKKELNTKLMGRPVTFWATVKNVEENGRHPLSLKQSAIMTVESPEDYIWAWRRRGGVDLHFVKREAIIAVDKRLLPKVAELRVDQQLMISGKILSCELRGEYEGELASGPALALISSVVPFGAPADAGAEASETSHDRFLKCWLKKTCARALA